MSRINPEKGFEELKTRVAQSVKDIFPIVGNRHTLKLDDIEVNDNKGIEDLRSQKKTKLEGRTWSVPVNAQMSLVDNATGKVIDKRKKRILNLPKITNRHSYIVDGQEYQMDNQWVLKPGVYSRRNDKGELESMFNLKGRSAFHVKFDPENSKFVIKKGDTHIPLKPILNEMGISDDQLEKSWGPQIFKANQAAKPEAALTQFYKASTGDKPADTDQARQFLREFMDGAKMDPGVVKLTLGKSQDTVGGDTIQRASEKLLGISRGETKPDARDSLMFKSFRSTEDYAEEALKGRSGEIMRRIGNNLDRKGKIEDIVGADIFNRPINQMFTKTSLANRPDQTNPLEMYSGAMKTTIMGEGGIKTEHRITEDAKLVDPSHLGFLDPVHSPEGSRSGVTLHLPIGATKVGNKVTQRMYNTKTKKMEDVDPEKAFHSNVVLADQVEWKKKMPVPRGQTVKYSGPENEIVDGSFKDADYVMTSPAQMYSAASNMIPFMANTSGNRATMAGRHMEQAIPLKHREQPLVEPIIIKDDPKSAVGEYVGRLNSHRAPVSGTVEQVKNDGIVIKDPKGEKHEVQIYDHFPLNDDKSFMHSTPLVKPGDKVKEDQIVADNNFTQKGKLALGTNLRVGVIPLRGWNFEDGIAISESAATKLTSVHMHRKGINRTKEHMFDKKKFLAYEGANITQKQADKLDDEGVIKKGQTVLPGDVLIASLREREETDEAKIKARMHKSLVKPYDNTAVSWQGDYPGKVTNVVKRGRRMEVHVKTDEPATIGDKLSERSAAKGIITRIVPDHEMPKTKDGKPIDVALNPLGVGGRLNLGQILETSAAKIAEKTGKTYYAQNFDGSKDKVRQVRAELKAHGIPDKEDLIDPKTGKVMGKALVGPRYMLKLRHQVEKKLSARAGGPGYAYDMTMIPKGGGPHGAQAMDSLGIYAMLAHGATANLRDFQSYKSNAETNDDVWKAIQSGEPLPTPRPSFAYNKFVGLLKAAGVDTVKKGNTLNLQPITDKQVLEMSNGPIKDAGKMLLSKNLKEEKGGLFDPKLTGGMAGKNWNHISLPEKMPNPIFEKAIVNLTGLKEKEFDGLMKGQLGLDKKTGQLVSAEEGISAGPAIEHLLGKLDVGKELTAAKAELGKPGLKGNRLDRVNKRVKYLKNLQKLGMSPSEAYMTKNVAVIPPVMRPVTILPEGHLNHDDMNGVYRGLSFGIKKFRDTSKLQTPEVFNERRAAIYDAMKSLSGMGGHLNRHYRGVLDIISGKKVSRTPTGAKEGKPRESYFQSKLIKRKQDMSMRSTVIPEPELGLDEIGIPRQAAMETYKPFVVREVRGMSGASPLQAQKMIKENSPLAQRALERVVQQRPLLVKRDPVLHKYGVQAFKPKLIGGKAIKIHPLVTGGFNMDFDGDTTSAFVPLSQQAVDEAHKMLPSRNLFSPATGDLMYRPTQESQLGIYILTQPGKVKDQAFKTLPEAARAIQSGKLDYTDQVSIGGTKTTVGRSLVAKALPEQMQAEFIKGKDPLNGKAQAALLSQVAKQHKNAFGDVSNKLKDLGNNYATSKAFSLGLDDLKADKATRDTILAEADKYVRQIKAGSGKEEAKQKRIVQVYDKASEAMVETIKKTHGKKPTNLFTMMQAGVKPNLDAYRQITMAPMLMMNAKGETIPTPIRRSWSEGLDSADYWTQVSGARKGVIQKVQAVQEPGYFTKMVVNSTLNNLIGTEDCGTKKGIALPIDEKDILDRTLAADIKSGKKTFKEGTLITPGVRDSMRNNRVRRVVVRSPLRCEHSEGLCAKSMYPATMVYVQDPSGCEYYTKLSDLFSDVEEKIQVEGKVELKVCQGWHIKDDTGWVVLERVLRHTREPSKKLFEIKNTFGISHIVTEDHTVVVERPKNCECGSSRISVDKRGPQKNHVYLTCRVCRRRWTEDKDTWDAADELEIRADKVLPGDRIRVPGVLRRPESDPDLDPYFLGVYLAEGSTDRTSNYPRKVTIGQTNNQLKDQMIKHCHPVTDNRVVIKEDTIEISDVRLVKKLELVLGSLDLQDIRHLGRSWCGWSNAYLGDVLAGLIDGDGHVREKAGTNESCVGSTSYALLVQLQIWLRTLGVRASLCCRTQKPSCGVKSRKDFFHLVFSINASLSPLLKKCQKTKGMPLAKGKDFGLQHQYAIVLRLRDISDKIQADFVYDVTTASRRFLANGMLTHNCYGKDADGNDPVVGTNVGIISAQALGERSTQLAMRTFHCLHKHSMVLVKDKDRVFHTTIGRLYENPPDPGQLEVWDKNGWTPIMEVNRHLQQPGTAMMMIRSRSGYSSVSQDNHPHMLRENSAVCDRCGTVPKKNADSNRYYCRKCKARWEDTPSDDAQTFMVSPDEIKRRSHRATLDKGPDPSPTKPIIEDGWLAGIYCAEGSILVRDEKGKPYAHGINIDQNDGPVRDRIKESLIKFAGKCNPGKRSNRVYSVEIAKLFQGWFGRYSRNVGLPPGWSGYPRQWLLAFVAAVIDGEGTVAEENESQWCGLTIDTTSYLLAQQVHWILRSEGLNARVVLSSWREASANQGMQVSVVITQKLKDLFPNVEKLGGVEGKPNALEERFEDVVDYVKPFRFSSAPFVYDIKTGSGTFYVDGLWTHNSGGVAPVGKAAKARAALTDDFNRVQQLVQMTKTIPGSAPLSGVTGKVTRIRKDPAGGHEVFVGDQRHYVPHDRGEPLTFVGDKPIKLKRGMELTKGDPLSAGPINPHELLPLGGVNKVQGYLAGQLYDLYKNEGIRRRNIETVVKSMTNLTQVKDPGDHPEYLRGDFAPTAQIQVMNKNLAGQKKKPITHTPVLKGVKTLPLDIQTDWMARLNHERLADTVIDAANQGWSSQLHGANPIPGLAYGAEFGEGKKRGKPY